MSSAGTASAPASGRVRRTSGWARVVAAAAGAVIGYLALLGALHSSVRFGDDLPWLFPDGALGTAWGYAVLALPLVGLLLGLVLAPRVPRTAWWGALVASAVAVVLLTPPPAVDCGNSVAGFTCAGSSSAP